MAFKSSTTKGTSRTSAKTEATIDELKALFTPAYELKPISGLKMAVYGEPGIGKTHFTLTVPGDVYILDIEGKTVSVSKNFNEETQKRAQVLDIIEYVNKSSSEVNYDTILDNIDERIDKFVAVSSNNPDYKATIVIDSATEWWRKYTAWLMGDSMTSMNKLGKPVQTEYYKINSKMEDNLLKLRSTGWNIILTGHSYPEYVSAGEVNQNKKDPKWYGGTKHWSDLTIEIEKRMGKRVGIIRKCSESDLLLDMVIEEPTFEKIVALYKDKLKIDII